MPAVPSLVGENITKTYFDTKLNEVGNTKVQAVDIVRLSQTAFLDSTDLVIPVTAGGTYSFESSLVYDTAAAADVVIRLSYPSGTTGLITNYGSGTAITTTTNAINQQALALSGTSFSLTYGGVAVATLMGVNPSGSLFVTTSGNLIIGFAQAVSTASNSLLKAGSWARLCRAV